MVVKCIKGHEDLIKEGDIYTVIAQTSRGNYILQEVKVPQGFTSFSKDRFEIIDDFEGLWDIHMEEEFWAEQPTTEYTA